MIIKKLDGTFECGYCLKRYKDKHSAEECYEKHQTVLVPIGKADLNRLLLFIYSKSKDGEQLLTPELIKILKRYNTFAAVNRR